MNFSSRDDPLNSPDESAVPAVSRIQSTCTSSSPSAPACLVKTELERDLGAASVLLLDNSSGVFYIRHRS